MHGPRLVSRDEDDDQRPLDERLGGYDLSAVIGRRASEARLVGRRPIGPSGAGRRLPPGGGYNPPPGAPRPAWHRERRARRGLPALARPGRPARGLLRPQRRASVHGRACGGARLRAASARRGPERAGSVPPPSAVPGERRYHDGQKVRHQVFGEGQVVSSKLTRDDEEVTVAFPGQGIKKLMASLAGLEVSG